MPTTHSFSNGIHRFWPTFSWMENAWAINGGRHLSQKEHAYFTKCEISQLDIERHSRLEFSCTPPNKTNVWTATRLRRWAQAFLSVVVCGPKLQIGECEHVRQRHEQWVDKGLNNVYTWVLDEHGEAEGRATHGGSCIKMKRRIDGVLWDIVEGGAETSVAAGAEELKRQVESEGVTFLPHPLSTAVPWMVATKTRPKSVLRMIGKARRKEMMQQTLLDLPAKVDKLELAGAKHEWMQHIQLRVPKEIWSQNHCVMMSQMWVAYRDSTLQLNLLHPGRATDVKSPINAACGDAKESIPHIMWDCNRGSATWKRAFERWTGQQADDEHHRLLLPCIASRVQPPTTKSIQARINNRFGFFTGDHVIALQTI